MFLVIQQDTQDITFQLKNCQGDDYATGCLLDYNYFKKLYKMVAIDLSKQQALDSDPKAIQQIKFTSNLSDNNNILFFIIEEVKETI